MNDNSTSTTGSTTGEVARAADHSYQGTPTSPLQNPPPGYDPSATQSMGGGFAAAPPPVPPNVPANSYPPAMRGRYRQRNPSSVGPVILIGAGVVFLLNTLDVLPWGIWNQLWRLWPIVLIAIGLDLIIGRRNAALSLLLTLLLVGVGVAFLVYNGGFQPAGALTTSNINIPLAGAKPAVVTLELGTGNLNLDSTGGGESLATGTLEYYQNSGTPEQSVSTVGDQQIVTLRQRDSGNFDLGFLFGAGRSLEWNIHLNPGVPMTFKANLGAGDSTINLAEAQVNSIDINSGTGNATIVFPASQKVTSTIDGGVGNLSLKIPDGLQARMDVSTGIGNIDVDNRFSKQGNNVYITSGYNDAKNKLDLKLNVGVGNVEISR